MPPRPFFPLPPKTASPLKTMVVSPAIISRAARNVSPPTLRTSFLPPSEFSKVIFVRGFPYVSFRPGLADVPTEVSFFVKMVYLGPFSIFLLLTDPFSHGPHSSMRHHLHPMRVPFLQFDSSFLAEANFPPLEGLSFLRLLRHRVFLSVF